MSPQNCLWSTGGLRLTSCPALVSHRCHQPWEGKKRSFSLLYCSCWRAPSTAGVCQCLLASSL